MKIHRSSFSVIYRFLTNLILGINKHGVRAKALNLRNSSAIGAGSVPLPIRKSYESAILMFKCVIIGFTFLTIFLNTSNIYGYAPCTTLCVVSTLGNDSYDGTIASPLKTIQIAVDRVSNAGGGVVQIESGTYTQSVVIYSNNIKITGSGSSSTIITAPSPSNGYGIGFKGSLSDIVIENLSVTDFQYGIRLAMGVETMDKVTIQNVHASDNADTGIYQQSSGNVRNLTVDNVEANNNNKVGTRRGIWFVGGLRDNVIISNSTFNNNGIAGIDLNDGSTSSSQIINNTVMNNFDSGIALMGAIDGKSGGSGTLVQGNIVSNNGRFGIEIKNPFGNGNQAGFGSVVVRNNIVTGANSPTDPRDYAGIIAFKRYPNLGLGNPAEPVGVWIEGNTVTGFLRGPTGTGGSADGFGIVVEGQEMTVYRNVVSKNNIGIQVQSGNPDNTSSKTSPQTPYFDRGDASQMQAVILNNAICGNTDYGIRKWEASGTGSTGIDATNNWWGNVSGFNPPGIGDKYYSGSVGLKVSPFMVSTSDSFLLTNSPCPVAFVGKYSISGTVFEDFNYGGGSGRDLISSNGIGRGKARVELYDKAENFISYTMTDASGNYSFGSLPAGEFTVRVVNSTVTSSRPGYMKGLLPVQTFRTYVVDDKVFPDTERVGGEAPELIDSGIGSNTLSQLTNKSMTPQSISKVSITNDVKGVDFGFNFDTIVNINDSNQGSFRQFLTNSNALANGSLSQSGQPSGKEVSIFMISDGGSHPGLRAGLLDQLQSGVAVIRFTSLLPQVTDADTSIDGTTQTSNIGDTNSGTDGYSGAVGTGADAVVGTGDEATLSGVNRPEVEIQSGSTTNSSEGIVTVNAQNTVIRGIAIRAADGTPVNSVNGIGIDDKETNLLVEQCFIGTSASSFTDLGSTNRLNQGIIGQTSASTITIRGNLIGYVDGFSVALSEFNILVEDNTFAMSQMGSVNQGAEQLRISGSKGTVKNNYFGATQNGNIDLGSAKDILVTNNTLEKSMLVNSGNAAENASIHARSGASDIIIINNIISNTQTNGHGVMIQGNSYGPANRITISKNSIFGNGKLGINLNPEKFDILSTNDGVDGNDGLINPQSGNDGMDYPIFTSATLIGGNLKIKGFVGNAAGQAIFANSTIEIFIASDDGNNDGEIILGDGLKTPHGEGQRYLGTILADPNGEFDTSIAVTGLSTTDLITATATDSMGNTSEFGANKKIVPGVPNISLIKTCPSPSNCTTAPQAPGTDLTYHIEFISNGDIGAGSLTIVDGIPTNTEFKLGSETTNIGTTGLVVAVEFSNDYDPANPTTATWTYTPVSAGGGAAAGYDAMVKAIRWRATSGVLSIVSPNNTGTVGFTAKIK